MTFKNLLFLCCTATLFFACGQNSETQQNNTEQFSELGKDKSFKDAHEEPDSIAPILNGEPVSYPAPDGKTATAYALKTSSPSDKYLFVIHEWWGLNSHVKQEADRLAKQLDDVNVIALDLYDGGVATTRDEASNLMQGVNEDRAKAIINGAINMAGKNAKIATIGWCFGGGWSLKASIMLGEQGAGCVMYYGMPVDDPAQLAPLNADVLGLFAKKDEWITPEVVNDFKKMATKAGKNVEVHIFDADHAFANPSSPRYVENAAQQANALALDFLKKHL